MKRKSVAEETLKAIEEGGYEGEEGERYDISGFMERSIDQTEVIGSNDRDLSNWREKNGNGLFPDCEVEISLSSTLETAEDLSERFKENTIGILNFASARNPGGGFLNGAQAQEESLARSSGLYSTLISEEPMERFYGLHNQYPKKGFYSHTMIFSPSVPIFRNDEGDWLPPYLASFVTSPAVNCRVALKGTTGSKNYKDKRDKKVDPKWNEQKGSMAWTRDRVNEVMEERMGRILRLMERNGIQVVVLGSFGTGVFKNDPLSVALIWKKLLSGRFKNSFLHVSMGIIDEPTYHIFEEVFGSEQTDL